MITPTFSLTQDETHVTLVIRAPFAKLAHTEISVGSGAYTSDSFPLSALHEPHASSPASIVVTSETSNAPIATPADADADLHSSRAPDSLKFDVSAASQDDDDDDVDTQPHVIEMEAEDESADQNVLDEHEEARLVIFASKPYFLRLYLPGEVEEDTSEGAVQYLVDEGRFIVRLRKRHVGAHFEGLELLGRLLAPPRASHTSASLLRPSPRIECVAASEHRTQSHAEPAPESESDDAALADALEQRLHVADFDWFIEQTPAPAPAPSEPLPTEPAPTAASESAASRATELDVDERSTHFDKRSDSGPEPHTRAGRGGGGGGDDSPPVDVERVARTVSVMLQPPQYGFALRPRSRLLGALSSELRELIELPDPDEVPISERARLEREAEAARWEGVAQREHFLADTFAQPDDDAFAELHACLEYQPPWALCGGCAHCEWTEDERRVLLVGMPRREYLEDDRDALFQCLLQLVDILFAYCYDRRVARGEANCESHWNLLKLSATFSWLRTFSSLREVLVCASRRSVLYPLYRRVDLFRRVWADVASLLRAKSRVHLVRAMLEVRAALSRVELGSVLVELFANDYVQWLQSSAFLQPSKAGGASPLATLGDAVETIARQQLHRRDLELDLPAIEREARRAMQQEDDE